MGKLVDATFLEFAGTALKLELAILNVLARSPDRHVSLDEIRRTVDATTGDVELVDQIKSFSRPGETEIVRRGLAVTDGDGLQITAGGLSLLHSLENSQPLPSGALSAAAAPSPDVLSPTARPSLGLIDDVLTPGELSKIFDLDLKSSDTGGRKAQQAPELLANSIGTVTVAESDAARSPLPPSPQTYETDQTADRTDGLSEISLSDGATRTAAGFLRRATVGSKKQEVLRESSRLLASIGARLWALTRLWQSRADFGMQRLRDARDDLANSPKAFGLISRSASDDGPAAARWGFRFGRGPRRDTALPFPTARWVFFVVCIVAAVFALSRVRHFGTPITTPLASKTQIIPEASRTSEPTSDLPFNALPHFKQSGLAALLDPNISHTLKKENPTNGGSADNANGIDDQALDPRQVLAAMNAGVMLFASEEGDKPKGGSLIYGAALLGLPAARNLIVYNYPRSQQLRQIVPVRDAIGFAVDQIASHQPNALENFTSLANYFATNGNIVSFAKTLIDALSGDIQMHDPGELAIVAVTFSRTRGLCSALKQVISGDKTLEQDECSPELGARVVETVMSRQPVDATPERRRRGLALARQFEPDDRVK